MKEINNLDQIFGGDGGPYCDGQALGRAIYDWFAAIPSRMAEGSRMTMEAMRHGR